MKQVYTYLLTLALFVSCSQDNVDRKNVLKSTAIYEFGKLSQQEKRHILPFLLDSVEHDMYGIGVTKTKADLKRYGGLPGYFVNHYPTYTSGGLLFPVLRVYDHNGRLIDSLVGGGISKDGKSLLNIGGFSKPFDFSEVRIHNSVMDKEEEKIRGEIMQKKNTGNLTRNEQHYSSDFMSNIPSEDFADVQKEQDLFAGKGYDVDCVATVLRETKEETNMDINENALVLIGLHSRAMNQETKAGYFIKAASFSVCSFMIEMGDIYLDNKGKVVRVKLNKKAIKNDKEISKNLNLEDLTLKGGDDLELGVAFGKLRTLTKVTSTDKVVYSIQDVYGTQFNYPITIAEVATEIPQNKNYKVCNAFKMSSFGHTSDKIALVDQKNIRVLCG